MGNVVLVDVGRMIGVDAFVIARTFIGTLGFDRVRSVTGHRHVAVLSFASDSQRATNWGCPLWAVTNRQSSRRRSDDEQGQFRSAVPRHQCASDAGEMVADALRAGDFEPFGEPGQLTGEGVFVAATDHDLDPAVRR